MKSRLMIFQVCGLFFLCMNMHGQYIVDHESQNKQSLLTGNLSYDLTMNMDSVAGRNIAEGEKKIVYRKIYSPMGVGLYSFIIPGAGQFYTKDYLKGSIFLGAEVALWVIYLINEKNGDDKTNLLRNMRMKTGRQPGMLIGLT